MNCRFLALLSVIQAVASLLNFASNNIHISVPSESNPEVFQVYVDDELWFENDQSFVHINGKQYGTLDNSLQLIKQSTLSGSDKLGAFQELQASYGISSDETTMLTSIKLYSSFVVFEQK